MSDGTVELALLEPGLRAEDLSCSHADSQVRDPRGGVLLVVSVFSCQVWSLLLVKAFCPFRLAIAAFRSEVQGKVASYPTAFHLAQ